MPDDVDCAETIDHVESRTEEVHYSAIHTALEQYFDRDMPGKLTRIEYPTDEAGHGNARLFFAEVVERDA